MQLRLVLGMIVTWSTVACGPRASQWIHVTDCVQRTPVPNARVFVQEIVVAGQRERPVTLGHVARGGNTNTQGMTWDSFSVHNRSVAKAAVKNPNGRVPSAEANRQPTTRVPPDPQQPVQMCVYQP
jgi:hypothetical protein